jgi:uncharacterized protein (TIGR02301 family)
MRMILILSLSFALAAPAAAQFRDAADRDVALVSLARIFGEMHHIRRLCAGGDEDDVWRDRMKRVIELEAPSFEQRERMVLAFNDGFSAAQAQFFECTAEADYYAASRAATGEALVSNIAAAAREAALGPQDESVARFPQ